MMKRITAHISSFIVLIFMGMQLSHAQYNRFDNDINSLRNSSMQNFRFTYDDYLQYSPAGLMAVMKACGYEGRSSWPRMIVSDALSAGIMAAAVNGLKYTVRRPRPDGSGNNSFPSGHTATAFMSATMLYKEYGWRSPWFGIGGYTLAAATGVSRILNNKHWMTDIAAGAAIGIGSVHLGYYLSDILFKEKGLSDIYEPLRFQYDSSQKHYVAELLFGHRNIIGCRDIKDMMSIPLRGGLVGLSADIPIKLGIGVTARISANSLIWSGNLTSEMYSTLAGGYWNLHMLNRLEFQAHLMAGYAWVPSRRQEVGSSFSGGADLAAGVSLSFLLDSNFKVKAFADFETFSLSRTNPWMNSVVLGWSSAWFW